jgi:phthalate 4,5-dioxygenase
MLSAEHNGLITRTGPGTPTGLLFRRYWMPALLADELPENDGPPVRVKLLSGACSRGGIPKVDMH